MRYLLLQARLPQDPIREEECRSFAEALGVPGRAVNAWNVVTEGAPPESSFASHDALLVGGSGDFLVSQGDMPHLDSLLAFLRDAVDREYPTFASCFGFQCLTEALGGEIVYDPDGAEVGTYDVRLTAAGGADPLFETLPDQFAAQLGRKDRAQTLPPGVVNLATSRRCPSQAFRVVDKPIWASQFHPELTEASNRQRFLAYMANYQQVMGPGALRAAAARFRPSPQASSLLRRFARLLSG